MTLPAVYPLLPSHSLTEWQSHSTAPHLLFCSPLSTKTATSSATTVRCDSFAEIVPVSAGFGHESSPTDSTLNT